MATTTTLSIPMWVTDICGIGGLLVAIIALITNLSNTDAQNIQKIMLEQAHSLEFLTKVAVTDTVIARNAEFKLCDRLQDEVELYFRVCRQLSFPQAIDSNDYTLDEKFEIYKNNLKLINDLNGIGDECRNGMTNIVMLNKKYEYYFNLCDGVKALKSTESFSMELRELATLSITCSDKETMIKHIKKFMESKVMQEYLENTTSFMVSSFNAVNIIKLQLTL